MNFADSHLSHSKFLPSPALLLAVLSQLLPGGCSPPAVHRYEVKTSNDGQLVSDTSSLVAIHHDFGIVRPGSHSPHQFRIRNSSNSRWIVKSVVTTCRCTATLLSANAVDPNGELLVDVQYHAPSQEGMDARSVEVHFRGSDAPIFELGTRAMIRHPLYVTDKELRIDSDQETAAITLLAANYSDKNWSNLRASTQAPWLSVHVSPVSNKRVSSSRQAWRVTIAADTTKLPSGDDRALVLFEPEGDANVESQQTIVTILRRPAVRAIPSRLFLGTIAAGQRVDRRVIVQLSDTSLRQFGAVSNPSEFKVSSFFSGKLSHSAKVVRNNIVAIDLTLVAPDFAAVVDEMITVDLGGRWPQVEVPLSALVEVSP